MVRDNTKDGASPSFWDRRRLIRESGLTVQQKLLLFIMADYIGDNEAAFVSRPTLARDMSLKQRQTRNVIQSLEGRILEINQRPGRTNLVRINWAGVQSSALVQPAAPVQPIAGEGVQPIAGGGAPECTGGVQPIALEHTSNTHSTSSGTHKSARTRFVPPTVEEVKAYCDERGKGVDPEQFVDHYTANGWVQGKSKPIRDWKAAVRTWERNGYGTDKNRGHHGRNGSNSRTGSAYRHAEDRSDI